MRWQRPVRWMVAVAGVSTAVMLYVQTRERPAVDRPPVATPADPEATVQSAEGTTIRYGSGGEIEFSISYNAVRQYADGRTVWDGAQLRIDDSTSMAAKLVESVGPVSDGMPAEIKAVGNVLIETEGASIRGEQATYTRDTGVAILPGPVSFSHGRISGGGVGGEYHRDAGLFHVLADAKVTSQADEQGGMVEATARSMTFNRAGLILGLNENAQIAHEQQHMASDTASLHLSEDREQFKAIELRGQSSVTPVPGKDTAMPDMRARDIDLTFHEGTQTLDRARLAGSATMVLVEGGARQSIEADDIAMTMAPDGRTVTHLDAADQRTVTVRTPARPGQAARTVTAPKLVASGEETKGLTSAVFSGGARFEEIEPAAAGRAATMRIGTSQLLTLKLAGQIDAVEEAQFERNVRFEAGDVTGDADLGNYMASSGRLTLRPAQKTPALWPRVASGRVTVDAREFIDVDLDTQDLHARGDVKTVSAPAPESSPDRQGGLFNDREALLGFGAEFWYEQSRGGARYRGTAKTPARVTQGETDVMGQSIELADDTHDLTAKGSVESTFVSTSTGDKAGEKQTHRVVAETLEYRDSARTATYTGAPVTLTSPDNVIVAQTIVMAFGTDGRELERLDARSEVHVKFRDGREALADTLLYDAGRSRYTLRGQPLIMRTPGEKAGACSQSWARVAYFLSTGDSSLEFPDAENPGGVERRDVSCTGALRK